MKQRLYFITIPFLLSVSLAFSQWTQESVDIDGETLGDLCGFAVSLSADGSRLAVGAALNGVNSGHVRIYSNPVLNSPLTDYPGLILSLYPNPAGNMLHIDLPPGTELQAVSIYNTQGQRVATANTTAIALTQLAAGGYI